MTSDILLCSNAQTIHGMKNNWGDILNIRENLLLAELVRTYKEDFQISQYTDFILSILTDDPLHVKIIKLLEGESNHILLSFLSSTSGVHMKGRCNCFNTFLTSVIVIHSHQLFWPLSEPLFTMSMTIVFSGSIPIWRELFCLLEAFMDQQIYTGKMNTPQHISNWLFLFDTPHLLIHSLRESCFFPTSQ